MFNHGDEIEYEVSRQWRKGLYVAPSPVHKDVHIHLTTAGFVSERRIEFIRKAKQKKEGWVNIYPSVSIDSDIATTGCTVYSDKETAIRKGTGRKIDTVWIEWEE